MFPFYVVYNIVRYVLMESECNCIYCMNLLKRYLIRKRTTINFLRFISMNNFLLKSSNIIRFLRVNFFLLQTCSTHYSCLQYKRRASRNCETHFLPYRIIQYCTTSIYWRAMMVGFHP